MTIKQALEKGTIMLKGENLDSPKIKARLLMQDILNKPRTYLLVHDNQIINEKILEKYFKNIEKVKNGIPIEHITHQKEFMKLSFYVNENVLIPRQDTEVLVEEVISIAKRINAKKILDLCTGSGSIAVSLAKYIENSQIIVSNPPYIKKDVIKKLSKDVQNEPIIALDGGKDGLVFYKKIVNEAIDYLKLGGYLCLEIGYDQKKDVMDLIKENLQYINTYSKKDLYDNDRIVVTKVGG